MSEMWGIKRAAEEESRLHNLGFFREPNGLGFSLDGGVIMHILLLARHITRARAEIDRSDNFPFHGENAD